MVVIIKFLWAWRNQRCHCWLSSIVSTQLHRYSVLDQTAPAGPVLNYRLRQTHTNGTTTFAGVVPVVPLTKATLTPSPVPGHDVLSVEGAPLHTPLLLWNAAGQLLRQIPVPTPRVRVDRPGLPAGLYYLQAQQQRVCFSKY